MPTHQPGSVQMHGSYQGQLVVRLGEALVTALVKVLAKATAGCLGCLLPLSFLVPIDLVRGLRAARMAFRDNDEYMASYSRVARTMPLSELPETRQAAHPTLPTGPSHSSRQHLELLYLLLPE